MLPDIATLEYKSKAVTVNIMLLAIPALLVSIQMLVDYEGFNKIDNNISATSDFSGLIIRIVSFCKGLIWLAKYSTLFFLISWTKSISECNNFVAKEQSDNYPYLYWLVPFFNIYIPFKKLYIYTKNFKNYISINLSDSEHLPLDITKIKIMLIATAIFFSLYLFSDNIFGFILGEGFFTKPFENSKVFYEEQILNGLLAFITGILFVYIVKHITLATKTVVRHENLTNTNES